MDLASLSRVIDDNSSAFVTATRRANERAIVLTLEFDDPRLTNVRHTCELHCTGVHENNVVPGFFESLSWLNVHPLLLNRLDPQASLYFSSRPKSAAEVILQAQIAIESATQGWGDPCKVLNGPVAKLVEHLNAGSGLLASGPLSIVDEIARAVCSQLEISVLRHPQRATGLGVLLFDSAWIVCASVDVVVLTPPSAHQ